MLDEEKVKRATLADEFQGKMAEVQEVLNKQKEQRNSELEENKAIREKIRQAIEVYKVKEEKYQSAMSSYQTKV
jgi:membrane protein involved in colicin uptake